MYGFVTLTIRFTDLVGFAILQNHEKTCNMWKFEYSIKYISALCLFDKKDTDMKNPQKFTCLCQQSFSVQKNKGLHSYSLSENLSLRKK